MSNKKVLVNNRNYSFIIYQLIWIFLIENI